MTRNDSRRKTRERRKNDATAWVLGGSLVKDRRRGQDRRGSKTTRAR